MSIKENFSELIRHGSIYMVGMVLTMVIRICLLPVFTRYIPAEDYGILSLLDSAVEMLKIFIAMGLSSAIVRFYHEPVSQDQKNCIMSTGVFSMVGLTIGVGCLVFWMRAPLARALIGNLKIHETYLMLCVANMLLNLVKSGPVSLLLVNKQSKTMAGLDVAQLLLAVIFNLWMVVFMHRGIWGMLVGNLAASALIVIFLFVITSSQLSLSFEIELLRKMVAYGLPVMISVLIAAGLHNLDRFFIKHYASLTQVGLYSLAYQFPFMLNGILASSLERIWGGNVLYAVEKEADAIYQYKIVSTGYLLILGYALFFCSISGKTIVTILLAPEYRTAWQYIPPIAAGVWFYGFHTFFKTGVVLTKKTYLLTINFCIALGINLIANWLLVRQFEAMGAAVATLITYGCFSGIGYFIYRGCYPMEYDFKRLGIFFVYAIGLSLVRTELITSNFNLNLATDALFVASLPVMLWYTPRLLSPNEKAQVKTGLKNLFRRTNRIFTSR